MNMREEKNRKLINKTVEKAISKEKCQYQCFPRAWVAFTGCDFAIWFL